MTVSGTIATNRQSGRWLLELIYVNARRGLFIDE
jgi:hypothetical protein